MKTLLNLMLIGIMLTSFGIYFICGFTFLMGMPIFVMIEFNKLTGFNLFGIFIIYSFLLGDLVTKTSLTIFSPYLKKVGKCMKTAKDAFDLTYKNKTKKDRVSKELIKFINNCIKKAVKSGKFSTKIVSDNLSQSLTEKQLDLISKKYESLGYTTFIQYKSRFKDSNILIMWGIVK